MSLIKPISNRIELRRLKREKRRFERENRIVLDEAEFFGLYDVDSTGEREILANRFHEYENRIRAIETEKLRRFADKWGIRIKKNWINLAYSSEGKPLHMLTDEAVEIINDTIRQKRRESIEWWVTKVIVPIIGALTGLIGVLLAVYALSYKN